jgi:hypothetical protein
MELKKMLRNSASVKFYSNLINYANQLNFEKTDFKNLTDIFGMLIEFGTTIIENFVKKENSDDPQIKMIQSSLQVFSQKFFQGFGIILRENYGQLGNYAA